MEINRIYISYTISKEIFESQVLNWSEYLQEYGFKSWHLIFFYKSQQNYINKNFNSLKNKIIFKEISKIFFFKDFQFLVYLFTFILSLKDRKNIVLVTRDASFSHIYVILKFFFRIKIIYEIRAAGEYFDKSIFSSLRKFVVKIKEKFFVTYCDLIFCVSNYLKNFKVNELMIKNTEKIKVFWGVADDKRFYFNEALRLQMREKLGIKNDEIVLVYSGSLINNWNEANFLIPFLSNLLKMNSKLKLMILTQDIDDIKTKYASFLQENTQVILSYCEQDELNLHLNAADIGLLLRRDHLVNLVSSPTKFSEYILTGLPVVITKSVRDFSEFTIKYDCGLVIDNLFNLVNQNSDDYINLINFIEIVSKYDRNRISNLGKQYLSKISFIEKMRVEYIYLFHKEIKS